VCFMVLAQRSGWRVKCQFDIFGTLSLIECMENDLRL